MAGEFRLGGFETVRAPSAADRVFEALYRQVVTLTLEGFGYAEIADVLGITESNVGARLTRARQMLRQLL